MTDVVALHRSKKNTLLIIAIIIALVSSSLLVAGESYFRKYAIDGIYFQELCSSENMMQTVALEDLRDSPVTTLMNIHIQPPGLDLIRMIIIQLLPHSSLPVLAERLDNGLYLLWAMLFGGLCSIIFLWLAQSTSIIVAVSAAMAFMLHPAGIFYASMLDGTFLSAFIILLTYYQLWKIRYNPNGPIALLSAGLIGLFLTRSIFNWPAIFVFAIALLLFKISKRKIFLFCLITGSVVALYTVKQYFTFGLTSTSSFVGLNLIRSIDASRFKDALSYGEEMKSVPVNGKRLPNTLIRELKYFNTPNYNNIGYLAVNAELVREYRQKLSTMTFKEIMENYRENLAIYMQPSSSFSQHIIVDRLFWRDLYDRVFSYPLFPLLFCISCIYYLISANRGSLLAAAGMALPGVFIFVVSVLFEKGENMRFKFFLEPVMYVFIVSQLAGIAKWCTMRSTGRAKKLRAG